MSEDWGAGLTYNYVLEVDARVNKRILISTNKLNGEQFKYTLLMDAINNVLNLEDDVGNSITMNSSSGTVEMKNTGGATITLSGNTVTINGNLVVTGTVTAPTFDGNLNGRATYADSIG